MTTISANSTIGIYLTSPSYLNPVVVNPGITISPSGSGVFSSGSGIFSFSGAWIIQNDGTIAANPTSGAGVALDASGGSITNQSSASISGFYGILNSGGSMTVVNFGSITGDATSGFGVLFQTGGVIANATNATISGSTGIGDGDTGGFNGITLYSVTVINAGVIAGNATSGDGINLSPHGGSVTNQSGGTIGGYAGISGGDLAVTVVNYGSIAGSEFGVVLDAGGSITNQSAASISGFDAVDGFIVALTIVNYGSIAGNATSSSGKGIVLQAGGSVTNQSGAAISGFTGIYGNGGALTVVNAGSITGLGINGFGVDLLAGGLVSNATTGTIASPQGIGVKVTGAGGTLINAGVVMTSAGTHAAINMYMGGYVSNAATGTIDASQRAGVYITGAAGKVVNAGVIMTSGGTHVAVDLLEGGYVSNAATGTISSFGGTGVYITGTTGTVINVGNVAAGGTHFGVNLREGGYVSNAATGTISSGYAGVDIKGGAGTLVNTGDVQSSLNDAVYMTGGVGTVINTGVIITSASAHAAINLSAGGYLSNAGTISAISHGGIYVSGAAGTVVNTGLLLNSQFLGVGLFAGGWVTNESTGTITGGSEGVFIDGAGTVINAGTISGATSGAVLLQAGYIDRVVIDPGAVFYGAVDGGNVIGSTIVSTLELASGASVGTLTGLGSQYINFSQITIDAGATWTLAGADTLIAGQTLTLTGATLTDPGNLVNNGGIYIDPSRLTVAGLIGSGSVTIDGTSTLEVQDSVSGSETIAFTGSDGMLALDSGALGNFSGVIQGFTPGDRIVVESTSPATFIQNGSLVSVIENGTTAGTLGFTDTADAASAVSTSGGLEDVFPRILDWSGATSTDFGTASNWDDTTDNLDPATAAPHALDTAELNGSGGLITGSGSVAALSFGGDGDWHLASGADLSASGDVVVGSTQAADLLVNEAGNLVAAGAVITSTTAADGSSVTVSGEFSKWNVTGALDVGNAASGALNVNAGAMVTASSLDAGILATSDGVITVTDAGSSLSTTGSLTIGDNGAGELSTLNGASVSVGGNLDVGQSADGSGNVDIENASLTVAGNLNLGLGGNAGVLTVGTGGFLQVDGGLIGGPDSVLNEFGDPVSTFDDGVNTNVGASETQDFTAYIDDFASFTIDAGVTLTLETPSIYDDVALVLGGRRDTTGDELILNAGSVSADTTVMFNNKFGTLVLGTDTLGTIDIQANDTAAATLVANPDLGVPTIANFDGVIENFTGGDRVVVDTDGAATFSVNGSVVSVIQNGNPVGTLTVDVASGTTLTAADFVDNALCFLAGTLIGTPAGPVPVERLAIGDAVLTASGTVRPIVWIGSGQVMVTRGRRSAATPVIVRKGALAKNVPHRDLHVTKGHSLYIDDVLIPVEFLINHRSILWDDHAQEVTLYHVELETHDVLLANGAPAESYRDDGNRWLFHNANTGWGLPLLESYAPVLTGGAVLDAVWRRLLERAGPRSDLPITDKPDLHLLVDGQRVDGSLRPNGHWMFDLPRCLSELRVVSRAGSPAELGLARDPRVLGVAVRQIRLWQGRRLRMLDAADESLAEGFHAFELDNDYRWTDGDAALPATLFAGIEGACQLELLMGGATQYLLSARRISAQRPRLGGMDAQR